MASRANASWGEIALIYLIGVFGMLVVSVAVPALGPIAAEFRPPSPSTIGWVMSIPALAAALCSLIVGGLVDRFGDRPLMLIGGALAVIGDAGVVSAPSIGLLLAWRVVGGLGYVCVVVAAVAMISRRTDGRRRTAALALWSTVIPASFILSSLYGAASGAALPWRMVFMAHGAGTVVLMLLGWLLLPSSGASEQGSRLAGLGAVFRTPWPFVLGASFAAAAFLQTGFVATLPHLLAGSIGVTEAQVYSFGALAMLCNVAGAFFFGLLYNRGISPWRMGVCATLLCLLTGLGLILAPTGLAPAIVMNCGLMAGLGTLVGMWALLPTVAPSPQCFGATSGLITQVTLLGVLFGPPSAFAAGAWGVHGLLAFLMIGIVLTLVAWPVWRIPGSASPLRTAH